jgi:hypothetical protein
MLQPGFEFISFSNSVDWMPSWKIMPMFLRPLCKTKEHYHVRCNILTAVATKRTTLWDIMSCSPLKVNRRYRETYCLHLQGGINWVKYQISMTCSEGSHGTPSSAPWKIVGSLHHMTGDLSSLQSHAGLCTLPLWGHSGPTLMTRLPSATSTLIPHRIHATHSLDTTVLCPIYHYNFPHISHTPAKPSLFRASYTSVLVSYWFAQ